MCSTHPLINLDFLSRWWYWWSTSHLITARITNKGDIPRYTIFFIIMPQWGTSILWFLRKIYGFCLVWLLFCFRRLDRTVIVASSAFKCKLSQASRWLLQAYWFVLRSHVTALTTITWQQYVIVCIWSIYSIQFNCFIPDSTYHMHTSST